MARPGDRKSTVRCSGTGAFGPCPMRAVSRGAKIATRQRKITKPSEIMADLVAP